MQLALGDALAIALLESRGFTALDFRALHPGGRLGALLTFIRDIMHGGEQMPLKTAGTKMSDAIVEMSAKGFGCVGITDGQVSSSASSPTAICAVTCALTCSTCGSRT